MYKHMLLATDGTEVADKAVEHGLALAKAVGAEVTLLTVTMPWSSVAYGVVESLTTRDAYESAARARAQALLDQAAKRADELGVRSQRVQVADLNPYQAIITAAKERNCDLIVVGAHGRRGFERLLLGSETTKVLTHSKCPVLVWRG